MSHVCPCHIRDSSDSIDTPLCPFDCNCCMYWLLSIYCTVSTLPRFLNASGSICSFICSEIPSVFTILAEVLNVMGLPVALCSRPRLILFRVSHSQTPVSIRIHTDAPGAYMITANLTETLYCRLKSVSPSLNVFCTCAELRL